MQKLLPILFRLFLLLALSVTSAAAERKERKAEPLPKPPPQPVEQSLKIRRGETLTIPLKIYGSQREPLRFLIRKEPANGKLSKPQQRDRESALVTYEPPADLDVVRDQFSYAVQNSAGVSASVDVQIAIEDDPPALLIPDSVEFPPILAGQSSSQEIEIKNGGGGMAAGELKVDAPWRIEGSPEYKLGAGESRKVKLVFAPLVPGPFRAELQFTSDKSRAVGLRGEAQAAIAAVPSSVILQGQSGEVLRVGVFELVNGTNEPQTVTVEENPRLQLPKTIDLPPNGKVGVTVQAAANSVSAISGDIVLRGAGVEVRVPVSGRAVGAVLRRLGDKLAFASVTPGNGGVGTIDVQNVGGAEGYWRWETIPPFSPVEEGVKLEPGDQKTLAVRLDPGASGQYRAVLKLVGEQQTVEVLAEVNAASGSAPRVAQAPTRSSASQSKSSIKRVSAPPSSRRASEADEPVLGEVAPLYVMAQRIEPTRALIVWKIQEPEGNYRLEVRSIGLDAERKLKITWADAPSTHVRVDGQRIIGEISGLTPNTVHGFRLVNVPPGANVGKEVGMVQFRTPVAEPTVKFTVLRGLVLFLAISLGFIAWRRFRDRRFD